MITADTVIFQRQQKRFVFMNPTSNKGSITQLSRQIHRTDSRLWQLKKAHAGILPYCLQYKKMDLAEEIVKAKKKSKELHEQRENLKAETPRELWYPHRKQQGRNNLRRSEVITQIMRECYEKGWNVKSIAAYWGWGVVPVYRRVNIKTIKLSLKHR